MSTAAHLLTADELFRLPEDESRWCELVEGEIVRMSPPGFVHGIVSQNVAGVLLNYVQSHRLGLVVAAETGFIVARDPDSVMAPDGAFVRQERLDAIGIPKRIFRKRRRWHLRLSLRMIASLRSAERFVAGWMEASRRLGSSIPPIER